MKLDAHDKIIYGKRCHRNTMLFMVLSKTCALTQRLAFDLDD